MVQFYVGIHAQLSSLFTLVNHVHKQEHYEEMCISDCFKTPLTGLIDTQLFHHVRKIILQAIQLPAVFFFFLNLLPPRGKTHALHRTLYSIVNVCRLCSWRPIP